METVETGVNPHLSVTVKVFTASKVSTRKTWHVDVKIHVNVRSREIFVTFRDVST